MNTRPLLNMLFGVSVGGIIILSILLVGITNDLRINLNDVRNGDVYAKSITKDKLADDVFNTVDLILEDGTSVSAQLVKATIKDGMLTDSLEFQTEDGNLFSAKVLNQSTTNTDILGSIPNGSITEEKLSTLVVTKLNEPGTTTIVNNISNGGDTSNVDIPDGSIITAKLANGAVTSEKLADGSVGTIKLLDGSITSSKLTDGVVLTQHLANSSITSFKIADNAITTSKILDNIITTVKIQDNAITSPKIADNAITSLKLADGSVTELKIVDGSVSNGKIADGSVTAFKIANDAVITAKILDGNVTEAKLASGSISLAKLSSAMCSDGEILQKSGGVWVCTSASGIGVQSITAGSGLGNSGTATNPILDANVDNVTIEISADTLQIKDGAITSAKLADGSVATAKIIDGNVTNGKLADDAVTTNKILDGAVTSSKIADGTITNTDIAAGAAIAWTKISKTGSSLADLATRNASDLNIADAGNFYTATQVEGALQEIGSSIDTLSSSIGDFFANGGNAFGGTATLGTTDNNALQLITNNSTAITILANGNIGIGDNSPSAKLTFAASTSNTGGLLFGSDTNLYRYAANVLRTEDAFIIGTRTDTLNPGDLLTSGAASFGNASTTPGSSAILDVVDSRTTSTSLTGLRVLANFTPSTTSLTFTGGAFTARDTTSNTNNIAALIGVTGSATVQSSTGVTANTLTAFNSITAVATGNTVSNLYGLRVNDITNNGTIGSTYGVHVGDITTGTQSNTPYSFYASDANAYNYFGGAVGIGTTIPGKKLEINSADGNNLRLTYNDSDGSAANYTDFLLSSNGTLTITSTGGLNLLNDGSVDVNIAGGSSATGCTITNSSGNLTCSGNIIGASTGTVGYLTRSGTTLSPATSGDNFTTSGNITTSGSGVITSAGLLTAQAGLTVSGSTTINGSGSSSTTIGSGSGLVTIGSGTGNLALGNSTGTFSLTSNGGLNVSTGGALTGVASINTISTSSTALTFAAGGTLSATSTGLNLQADGSVDVNIAGGSSATGCTITNSNGNLSCSGNITGAATGTVGYWSRSGTTLTPATSNDILAVTLAATGVTTNSTKAIQGSSSGTFNTTAGGLTNYAGYFTNTSTRASGANNLVNVGLYATASGAQNNFAAIFESGLVGIGTTNPTSTLYVQSTTDAYITARTTNSGGNNIAGLQLINGGAVTWYVRKGVGTSDSLEFFNTGTGTVVGLWQSNGNLGIGDTSPASLFTVGANDAFQVNSSGNVVAVGGAAHSISNSSGLTITAAATGLNLQADGSVNVNIAGGSSATGCTINNTTGDLTCTGSINGSSTGTSGFWTRTGAVLSPTNSNDIVAITQAATGVTTDLVKNLSVSASGTYNTTSAALINYSGFFSNTSTRSAGGNDLTNIGLYTTASGAQNNYGLIVEQGSVGIGTTTPLSLLSVGSGSPFQVNGSGAVTAVGVNSGSGQIQGTGGLTILGTTSINASGSATTTIGSGSGSVTLANGTGDLILGNSTGTFSLTSNGGLNVSTGGALTGVASIDTISITSTTIGFAGAGTISATSTGLNLQTDGSINVNIAGGSSATGCTIENSTGNLTCTGNISGATTGTSGYWSRSGTTISPATSNDILAVTLAATGVTTNSTKAIQGSSSGTFNTTAGGLTNYAGYFTNTSTRASGSNNLVNVGLYASASGAQNNFAGIFENGLVGIGTTNPTSSLYVQSAVDAYITIRTTNSGGNKIAGLSLVNGGAVTWDLRKAPGTSDAFQFNNNDVGIVGTWLSGGNLGIGDTSPTSLFTVGNGDLFQVNSSGNIVSIGGAAHSISSSSGLTISAATTGLNLQADGSVDVNLAGGSSATGCTINNTTGDLTCTGSISGTSTGSFGYWTRTGTTISTATANDVLSLSTNSTTAPALNIVASGDSVSGNASALFINSSDETTALPSVMITYGGSGRVLVVNDDGTTSDSSPFVIDGSGNVGIGENTPGQKLVVAGGNILMSDTGSKLYLSDTNHYLSYNGSNTEMIFNGGNLNFGNGSSTLAAISSSGLFSVGATQQFQVNSSGNIAQIGGAAHTLANSSGALNIDSASTGAINIGTAANAKILTFGNSTGATALNFISGTGAQTFTSSVSTGTGANSAFAFTANSLSSGTGLYVSSTSTSLSSGTLASLYWNPGSATSATGDILSLDVGSNGIVGNILNVKNAGSSVFSVSQSLITASLPVQFNAPGDIAVAYDLVFTNPTASYLKSSSSIYLQSGEPFNSSDLTLKTFNSGNVVIDSSNVVLAGITSCSSGLQTNSSGKVSCISSDQNLKENINVLTSSLNTVMGLRGVSYNWKDKNQFGAQTEYGLIAQEVEAVAPDLVFTMGNGYKGVKYQQMTGLLVEAIKEQQNQIEALRAQMGINTGTGSVVLTPDNIFAYFTNNIIPQFTVRKIRVNEEIIAKAVTVVGDTKFYGTAEFNNDVNVRNKINLGKDSAGKATITAGTIMVEVKFTSSYTEAPIVTATAVGSNALNSSVKYSVTNITKDGFKIELSNTLVSDIEFNWIAVGVDGQAPISYPGL